MNCNSTEDGKKKTNKITIQNERKRPSVTIFRIKVHRTDKFETVILYLGFV